MKKFIYILSILTLTTIVVSCSQSAKTETKAKTEKVFYTCPMHPEVKSDKLGKCPKCGDMELVKKEE
jgi:hypothetical protein